MNYTLKYLDSSGNLNHSQGNIGFWAFCKHLAFAGIPIYKAPLMLSRFLGYFWEFRQFWGSNPNSFELPSIIENDPTEISFISNRIGKAYADYFAKRIFRARFTHVYEDAMVRNGYKIKGDRPDFYCENLKQQFSIEAKGFKRSTVSDNSMNDHKSQSQTGPIPVNFSVASVAYNLYQKPTIKFYDPINDEIEYNEEVNNQLRSLYYNSILEMIEFLDMEESESKLDNYYYYSFGPLFPDEFRLILHRAIVQRDWYENDWLNNIEFSENEERQFYIDLDGVGIASKIE